jgi:hypothetical protein
MVIVIAVTFLVLWSPFYLFTMLLVHLIGFANSAVNPFVYALLGDKFRTAFVVSMKASISSLV